MATENHARVRYYSEKYNDILFAEFTDSVKIDLELAKQIVAGRLDFAKEKKHYLIIDVSNARQISTEAKEYLQRPDTGQKNVLGAAFIATNPVSALIAHIFIKTQKDFEAKCFTTEDEAFQWILKYRKKNRPQNLITQA